MKAVEIVPTSLKGNVIIPPSKSLCHRAVIAAALAQGKSIIKNVELSEDIAATIDGVQALGAAAAYENNSLTIEGDLTLRQTDAIINCRESGSTLRFLIPVMLARGVAAYYTGKGNLGSRPLGPYIDIFKQYNIYHSATTLPMEIKGHMLSGVYKLKGTISSQFITGLLMALPLLEGDSEILITDELESRSYVDLTIDVLDSFGVHVINDSYKRFYIKGSQLYKPMSYTVEGDYSQAAFWIAAGVLNGDVSCLGLQLSSKQGDKAFIDILKGAGVQLNISDKIIRAASTGINAFEADVSQCPDIAPILAVVAAFGNGTSRITGAARLRIKECDRLKAMAVELSKLGAKVLEGHDTLTISGSSSLKGGEVDSWGDHRIAMALSIASLKCREPVIIKNSDAVSKSYPNFYRDFVKLGGSIYERNLG